MSESNKTYVRGSAKEVKFQNGGYIINLSMNKGELNALPTKASKSGDEFITLRIAPLRTPDKYGNTHSVYYDNWEPSKDGSKKSSAKSSSSGKAVNASQENDDLPF
jgi:hypothetical protein